MTKKKKKMQQTKFHQKIHCYFCGGSFFSHKWIFQQISYATILHNIKFQSFCILPWFNPYCVTNEESAIFMAKCFPFLYNCLVTFFFFFWTKITININHKYMMTLDSFFLYVRLSHQKKNQLTKLTFRISFGISSLWMKTKKNW